jgi:phosphatidylinositol phospholipase C, delta
LVRPTLAWVSHPEADFIFADLGYMMNQAMFRRNGRSGYVLKPPALLADNGDLLSKHTKHLFEVTVSL